MARQELRFGAFANDHATADPIRTSFSKINEMFVEQYALNSDTISAGWPEFDAPTKEASIALADAACVSQGKSLLHIPLNMLPYDIALCPATAGVRRYREGGDSSVYDARAYGAANDNTGDQSAALAAVFSAWLAAPASESVTLVIPPGTYRYTSPLVVAFSGTVIGTRAIYAYGATLAPDFANGHGFEIGRGATGIVRNITINGLRMTGTNATDTTAALLRLNGGADSAGYLYRLKLRDCAIESVKGHGLWIEGNCFENQLFGVTVTGDSAVPAVGYCVYVFNTGAGVVSSIDMYGCVATHGEKGLYCQAPQGGVKVYGGSFMFCQKEGIHIENGTESIVIGAHIEQNWEGGLSSGSWVTNTDQAGMKIAGRAFIYGCYGTANNLKQRYVVSTYSSSAVTVVGGVAAGSTMERYARVAGAAGSKTILMGLGGGTAARFYNGLPATATLTTIGMEGVPDMPTSYVSADRGDANVTLTAGVSEEIQRFDTTLTANRTVTLAAGFKGAKFRIVRTGLGAFTLDVGGLKTIPSATAASVDVAHNGTAWGLTGYDLL